MDVEHQTFIHYTDPEKGQVGSVRSFQECQQGLAYVVTEHVAGQRRQIQDILRFSALDENMGTLSLLRNNEKCGVGEVIVNLSDDICNLLQVWKDIRAVPEGKNTVDDELIFIHCRANNVKPLPSHLLTVCHISYFKAHSNSNLPLGHTQSDALSKWKSSDGEPPDAPLCYDLDVYLLV